MTTQNLLAANFTKIAYNYEKFAENAKNALTEHLNTIPQGWEVLSYSGENSETGAYNYRAVAFVNNQTKEVVIANAGTDPTSIADINDDARLVEHKLPLKSEASDAFIEKILNKLSDAQDYSFAVTGHSLGGVMSDIVACQLADKGYNVTESVTFDNPGSKPLIEKAINQGTFKNVSMKDLNSDINFTSMQARPNIINTTNEQMGETKIVLAPKDVDVAKTHGDVEASNSESLGLTGYISHLFSKVGSAACDAYNNFDITNYSIGDLCSAGFYAYKLYTNMYNPIFIGSELAKLAGAGDIIDLAAKSCSLTQKALGISKKAVDSYNKASSASEAVFNMFKELATTSFYKSESDSSLDIAKIFNTLSDFRSSINDVISIKTDIENCTKTAHDLVVKVARVEDHSLDNFINAFQHTDTTNIFSVKNVDENGVLSLKPEGKLKITEVEHKEQGFFTKAWNWFTGENQTVEVDGHTTNWSDLVDLVYQTEPCSTFPVIIADDHNLVGSDQIDHDNCTAAAA